MYVLEYKKSGYFNGMPQLLVELTTIFSRSSYLQGSHNDTGLAIFATEDEAFDAFAKIVEDHSAFLKSNVTRMYSKYPEHPESVYYERFLKLYPFPHDPKVKFVEKVEDGPAENVILEYDEPLSGHFTYALEPSDEIVSMGFLTSVAKDKHSCVTVFPSMACAQEKFLSIVANHERFLMQFAKRAFSDEASQKLNYMALCASWPAPSNPRYYALK